MNLTTRIIHLDQLTKQFFDNKFPGFNHSVQLGDHVLDTNVPVVELDLGIDLSKILTLDICEQLTINPNIRPSPLYEVSPRMTNWNIESLWSDGSVAIGLKDIYFQKYFDPVQYKEVIPEASDVKDVLFSLGFDVAQCSISLFGPNGYVRPHRDIHFERYPLAYFWIPLNNPTGSEFKSYPYGTIDAKPGYIYLFNQCNFVHAVVNNSQENRYALLGYFSHNIPDGLANTIEQAIKEQYNTIGSIA